ncbi:MAG: glycoside hydrolase family 125 protein [Bacillota bacterium]
MSQKPESELILTVPDKMEEQEPCFITGNEYISLPEIYRDGSILNINFLHYQYKSLLEFSGNKQLPLLMPALKVNNETINIKDLSKWDYKSDWLPVFSFVTENEISLTAEIIAPPGFKGFYYKLKLHNRGKQNTELQVGWQGCWDSFNYIIFNRRAIDGKRNINYNRWTESVILEASSGPPLAGLAMAAEPKAEWHLDSVNNRFGAVYELQLEPGENFETTLYVAINLEADGASTSTVDMRRHGSNALYKHTNNWLESRRNNLSNLKLSGLMNKNLFFSYFFATGRALDNDMLVPVTSRSPRYYVSAAFWSRDSLLWSFPAIMIADRNTARELLLTAFTRHIDNAGDHAHYINGTVLYPGFELDQLSAYFLALKHYLDQCGEKGIIQETAVQNGLDVLAEKTFSCFDPESGLFRTFLDPSDDPVYFPYLTYCNALLQCAFRFLGKLQAEELWQHKSDFAILAQELEQAIYENCTVKGPFGMMFAWAVDGKGRFSLYDNPPGSLQLLAHYGFCSIDDRIFTNTVHWIRSSNNKHFHQGQPFEEAGSIHAENPWPLAACNDLLACNAGAEDFFKRAKMDNGFFCETIDPETGHVSTGAAFASAAGFLAYALKKQ